MDNALSILTSVLTQWRGYDWGMGPGMMFGWPALGWFWGVLMFASWFAVMVILFLLIRYLALLVRDRASPPRAEETALDILKKRYARGEVSKEEFEEKKRELQT